MDGAAPDRLALAWRELRRGASAHAVRARLFGSGPDALEAGQVDTLDVLAERDTWRMGELAAALWVDASTATRAVAPLVARGLVERTRDPVDGRCVRVALTPAGRARHQDLAARRKDVWNAMLEEFEAEELATFAEWMERLVEGLDAVASARV